jgi:hypothetical protein
MQENGRAFTKEELVSEVISKNIPSAWVKDFRMFKLHLKTQVRDVLTNLMMIELKNKLKLTLNLITPTRSNTSKILAEFIMEDTNGMTAIKTQKGANLKEKIRQMSIVKLRIKMVAPVKIDAPKKMDVKLLVAKVIAEQESQTAIMNITASIGNGKTMKELQVQKY